MAQSTPNLVLPLDVKKQVVLDYEGGDLTSDSGLVLLSQADARCDLTRRLAAAICDDRQASRTVHSLHDMLRARVLAIAAGYPDANDLDTLRNDPALKIACGRCPQSAPALPSQPTLSRFENQLRQPDLYRLGKCLVERTVALLPANTAQITIDLDATDDPCHGQQQLEGFNAYYDEHCYLPLLVQLVDERGMQWPIAALLRPGRTHPHAGVRMVLRHIVGSLRARFPGILITVRGDSGFGSRRVIHYLERLKIQYALGLPTNKVLQELAAPTEAKCANMMKKCGDGCRAYGSVLYRAGTTTRYRRVVVKTEAIAGEINTRFVVTNIWQQKSEPVYQLYCGRGNHENSIKESKLDLSSGRTSCHLFLANQGRLLMHLAAHLLWTIVREAAAGTQWAKAQVGTLRLQLLKVAARVVESSRRVWIHLCSTYPYRADWLRIHSKLCLPVPVT